MKRKHLAIKCEEEGECNLAKVTVRRPAINGEEENSEEEEEEDSEYEGSDEEQVDAPHDVHSPKKRLGNIKKILSKLEEKVSVLCEENQQLSSPINKMQITDQELIPLNYDQLTDLLKIIAGVKFMYYNQLNIRCSVNQLTNETDDIEQEENQQDHESMENSKHLSEMLSDETKHLWNEINLLTTTNAKLKVNIGVTRRFSSIQERDIAKLSHVELGKLLTSIESSRSKIDQKLLTFLK